MESHPSRFSILGDSPTENDRLDFDRFATSLANRLLSSAGSTPFTVGVLGDWGQGKTTLMRMLRQHLESQGCVTIWFSPWKYNDRAGVWKGLAYTLVQAIRASDNLPKEIRRKVQPLKRWLGGYLWSRIVGNRWGDKLIEAADEEPWSPGLIHEMQNQLDELFRWITPRPQQAWSRGGTPELPVVLFVDDLDRCFPDATRSVLEAIKLILDRPGMVTVMGIAEEELVRGVTASYAKSMEATPDDVDPEWGSKYIKKIIQMPVPVPTVTDTSFESYVGDCLRESGIGAALVEGDGDDQSLDEWYQILREASDSNLREVKRLLNHFISEMDKAHANYQVLRRRRGPDVVDVTASPPWVAFVLLLFWRFPQFHRHVLSSHDLLFRFQLHFTSKRKRTGRTAEDLEPFLHHEEIERFFVDCCTPRDGRPPLVPPRSDWREIYPYLQFGLPPAGRGAISERSSFLARERQKDASTLAATQSPDLHPIRAQGGDVGSRSVEAPEARRAEPSPEARSLIEKAQSLIAAGSYEKAAHKLRRMYRYKVRAGEVADEVALLGALATARQFGGELREAIEGLNRALKITQEIGDRRTGLRILLQLSEANRLSERTAEALQFAEAALESATELDEVYGQMRALGELGEISSGSKKFEEAQEYLERRLDLARGVGQASIVAETLLSLGKVLLKGGKLEEADADLEDAEEKARALGDEGLRARALTARSAVKAEQGDEAAAIRLLREGIVFSKAADALKENLEARQELIRLLGRARHWEEAIRELDELVKLSREHERLECAAEMTAWLGRWMAEWAVDEERRDVPGLLRRAAELYVELGDLDRARGLREQADSL